MFPVTSRCHWFIALYHFWLLASFSVGGVCGHAAVGGLSLTGGGRLVSGCGIWASKAGWYLLYLLLRDSGDLWLRKGLTSGMRAACCFISPRQYLPGKRVSLAEAATQRWNGTASRYTCLAVIGLPGTLHVWRRAGWYWVEPPKGVLLFRWTPTCWD